MPKQNTSIGLRIKGIREQKGLSQNDVVLGLEDKNIRMSRETLSKIEHNNRTVSAIELNAICVVLGIDISAVFSADETDDLVTLFRKKGSFANCTLNDIAELQDMIRVFLSQEEIFNGEFVPTKRRPLWEEC